MQYQSYSRRRQSSTHKNFFNYDDYSGQSKYGQTYTANYKLNEIRMSINGNKEFQKPIRIRARNVSMEVKLKNKYSKYQSNDYKYSEYYNHQKPQTNFKENQFQSSRKSIQMYPQRQYYQQQRQNSLQKIQRNSYFDSLANNQLRNIQTYNKIKKDQKINKNQIQKNNYETKKSTISTDQDSLSNRQKILEDIQQKFQTPGKIQDLLDYLSNKSNSNYTEHDSVHENTLLSSEKSTQENFYSNTADSFYSLNKQKKYSLMNRTYSQQQNSLQNSQKFDLQFYSVFDKLNPRKYSSVSYETNDNLEQKFNEYQTKIDYVDTQKFLDEVKQTLSQKNVGLYLRQLKQKQQFSNQFQQMNLNDQGYLFQGLYRFIPKDADELFSWDFFNQYRVENYMPFFNNPFVSNVKTTWIIDPNSRFPHTQEYILKRAICQDQFGDFVKYIKKVDLNKPIDFENNLTPLQLAAKLNKVLVLKYLIMIGADLNVQNKQGNTALMEALNEMSFDSIKQLVQNGAKIDIKDKYGIDVIEKANLKKYNSIQIYLKENLEQKVYPLQRTIQRPQYIKDCLLSLKLINKSQIQKYGRPLNYPFNDLRKNYLISFMNKIDF